MSGRAIRTWRSCSSNRSSPSSPAPTGWTRCASSSAKRPLTFCPAAGCCSSTAWGSRRPCARCSRRRGLKRRRAGPIWPAYPASRGEGENRAMDTKQRIKEQVEGHPVVLYMKGTPQFPQCGFSALACQVLNACGVQQFHSVNVLADAEIRQGIKEYANWPTIPQLYINGEFVGGSDIVKEMYESGELQKLLEGVKQA